MSHCGLLQFLNGGGILFTGQSGGKGLGRRPDQGTPSGSASEILCVAKRMIQTSPESLCILLLHESQSPTRLSEIIAMFGRHYSPVLLTNCIPTVLVTV